MSYGSEETITNNAESEFPDVLYDVYWFEDGAWVARVEASSESEAIEQALADAGLDYAPANVFYAAEHTQ